MSGGGEDTGEAQFQPATTVTSYKIFTKSRNKNYMQKEGLWQLGEGPAGGLRDVVSTSALAPQCSAHGGQDDIDGGFFLAPDCHLHGDTVS